VHEFLTGFIIRALLFAEKNIDGIWHTAIVVFGKEHFFGSNGISICEPVSTIILNYKLSFYVNR